MVSEKWTIIVVVGQEMQMTNDLFTGLRWKVSIFIDESMEQASEKLQACYTLKTLYVQSAVTTQLVTWN